MSGSGFTVKVKMNPAAKIIKDHGLDDNGRGVRFYRNKVASLSNPFVPGGSEGGLVKSITYPNNYSIKYKGPYARYQYYGKLMLAKNGSAWAKYGEKKHLTNIDLKYHTSGTGPKWDKLMLQRRKKDLIKDVENYIKNGGK